MLVRVRVRRALGSAGQLRCAGGWTGPGRTRSEVRELPGTRGCRGRRRGRGNGVGAPGPRVLPARKPVVRPQSAGSALPETPPQPRAPAPPLRLQKPRKTGLPDAVTPPPRGGGERGLEQSWGGASAEPGKSRLPEPLGSEVGVRPPRCGSHISVLLLLSRALSSGRKAIRNSFFPPPPIHSANMCCLFHSPEPSAPLPTGPAVRGEGSWVDRQPTALALANHKVERRKPRSQVQPPASGRRPGGEVSAPAITPALHPSPGCSP